MAGEFFILSFLGCCGKTKYAVVTLAFSAPLSFWFVQLYLTSVDPFLLFSLFCSLLSHSFPTSNVANSGSVGLNWKRKKKMEKSQCCSAILHPSQYPLSWVAGTDDDDVLVLVKSRYLLYKKP